ncbi:MAG: sensor histidine kinase [Paenibacillaceae bacterium]|nr:sensor histidine kinase [Paenibacillaceae bacterium]
MQKTKVLNKKKAINLRIKLIATYTLIVIAVVLVLQWVGFSYSSMVIKKNSLMYSEMLIHNVSSAIDDTFDEIDRLTQTLLLNEELANALATIQSPGDSGYEQKLNLISEAANSILSVRKDIDRIIIGNLNGFAFTSGPNNYVPEGYNMASESWYQAFMKQNSMFLAIAPHRNNFSTYHVFSGVRKIRTYSNPQVLGVIKIDLRSSVLDEICNKNDLGENSILLFDSEQRHAYSAGTSLTPEDYREIGGHLGGDANAKTGTMELGAGQASKIVNYVRSSYTGMYAALVVPEEVLFKDLKKMHSFTNTLAVICCLAALLLLVLNSFAVTKSIRIILKGIKRLEDGNLNLRIHVNTRDEFAVIADGLNHMVRKMKVLMAQNTEMQVKKKEAEMMVLQSQINPHFLYNTLDGIRMKALINKDDDTAFMIEQLSFMLRSTTNIRQEFVPLRHELAYINSYITLQNIRFRNKFELTVDLPEDLGSMIVPKFILQPIVENAVYHGLEVKKNDRRITVDSRIQDDKVWLMVKDNGIGMEKEQLQLVYEGLRTEPEETGSNIGLRNINSRLKLYYGEEYGLMIDSIRNEGTTVTLCFPLYKSLDAI